MLKPKAECGVGKETSKGRQTLAKCAELCRGSSQMFAHGTNEYGLEKCNADGTTCDCYCEMGAENYQCKNIATNNGFNLYTFMGE